MKKKKNVKKVKSLKRRNYNTGNPKLDKLIKDLIEKAGGSEHAELLREMMVTVLKFREDGLERGDIKMMTVAMKEMRYALRTFSSYRHVRKVALFGSARTPKTDKDYKVARDFAKEIVRKGWMVITGASSGIMRAGNEGAGRANSFGVNIRLPFEQDSNPFIANDPKLINFKYFFTRKLTFIRESDATVLCPGGFGTHDEGFETLTLIQTGKTSPRPVVCLDKPNGRYWSAWKTFLQKQLGGNKMIDAEDMKLIHFTHDPKEAVEIIAKFYSNYHSSRYIGDRFVFRLKAPLSKARLATLNKKFKDILIKGKFEQQSSAFPEEENEPHTLGFTRLSFYFNRRNFARLNTLIHAVNA